jgi:excisionase family DNA binding protein
MASYRPGQVAELVGVSVDTVRRWADSGKLPSRRSPGGQRVIDGPDLARFLADWQAYHPDVEFPSGYLDLELVPWDTKVRDVLNIADLGYTYGEDARPTHP